MKGLLAFILLFYFFNTNGLCQLTCNNWLKLSSSPDGVRIGDLDVSGDKITVEALFNRTAPYGPTYNYAGDIVSKHIDPSDCNYLLRPTEAEITTTNGFYATPATCGFQLNKTYHVALVYDGASLKFYRDGFLLSQVAATGNLIQNNWITKIGETAGFPYHTSTTEMVGYVNEVRIWNVARSQQQLRSFMNVSLPNPTNQTGLLAYYTFDNLVNKQGNAIWNGTSEGSTILNSSNPVCTLTYDSCGIITTPTCAVAARADTAICAGTSVQLTASGASTYTWSPATGLSNPNIANPVATVSSQVTYTVTGVDPSGCTAIDTVRITVLLKPNLNVTPDTIVCGAATIPLTASGASQYEWSPVTGLSNPLIANPVATVSSAIKYIVRGVAANGCEGYDSVKITIVSKPVLTVTKDTAVCEGSSIYLAASGAGQYSWTPSAGLSSASISNPIATAFSTVKYYVIGSNGGTCTNTDSVTITTKTLPNIKAGNDTAVCAGTSINLSASGGNQYSWAPPYGLNSASISNPVATVTSNVKYIVNGTGTNGCKGSDTLQLTALAKPVVNATNDTSLCGGGVVQLQAFGGQQFQWQPAVKLSNATISNPIATVDSSASYIVNVTGSNGCTAYDTVNIAVLPKTILVVSKDTAVCQNKTLQLSAAGASQYTWSPATGLSSANSANPTATVGSTVTYSIVGSASNGCRDTARVTLTMKPNPQLTVSKDTLICGAGSANLSAAGAATYQWFPVRGLTNASGSNPIATPDTTIRYYVLGTAANGCIATDSVNVQVKSAKSFKVVPANASLCPAQSLQLMASGGDTYSWSPAKYFKDTTIANPVIRVDSSVSLAVLIADTTCKLQKMFTIPITVNIGAGLRVTKDGDVNCSKPTALLNVSGGGRYRWSPASVLDNDTIANPTATVRNTTTFYVTAVSDKGCQSTDSITVNFSQTGKLPSLDLPNAFTPNNDGLNDCYGLKSLGNIPISSFQIFNRWGEVVFRSRSTSDCWDGRYKGQAQSTAAFVYLLRVSTACGQVDKKGTLLLIR